MTASLALVLIAIAIAACIAMLKRRRIVHEEPFPWTDDAYLPVATSDGKGTFVNCAAFDVAGFRAIHETVSPCDFTAIEKDKHE